jgi:hypothetical protein
MFWLLIAVTILCGVVAAISKLILYWKDRDFLSNEELKRERITVDIRGIWK